MLFKKRKQTFKDVLKKKPSCACWSGVAAHTVFSAGECDRGTAYCTSLAIFFYSTTSIYVLYLCRHTSSHSRYETSALKSSQRIARCRRERVRGAREARCAETVRHLLHQVRTPFAPLREAHALHNNNKNNIIIKLIKYTTRIQSK